MTDAGQKTPPMTDESSTYESTEESPHGDSVWDRLADLENEQEVWDIQHKWETTQNTMNPEVQVIPLRLDTISHPTP